MPRLGSRCVSGALLVGGMNGGCQGTSSEQKNELLFSQFHVNYNNEPAIFRKGSILFRQPVGSRRVWAAQVMTIALPVGGAGCHGYNR